MKEFTTVFGISRYGLKILKMQSDRPRELFKRDKISFHKNCKLRSSNSTKNYKKSRKNCNKLRNTHNIRKSTNIIQKPRSLDK